MDWLAWIVIGGIAGWIASIITKNNARMKLFANIFVGIIGGLVGGFLMKLIGAQGMTGFNLWRLLVSLVWASFLNCIINQIRRR